MINERVFRDTVSLIIELAGEDGIGGVKLNKSLIITDALHNAIYGKSLTGASYIKHRYGPVPGREAYTIIKKMIDSEDIMVFDEMVAPGIYEKNHYLTPFFQTSKDSFTKEEIAIVSWTVSTVMNMTAQQISAISHDCNYYNTPMFHEINLNDVCKWEIIEGTWSMKEEGRAKMVLENNFDEINRLIQAKEVTAHPAI